jgi:hypothetical protein
LSKNLVILKSLQCLRSRLRGELVAVLSGAAEKFV